ncbi:hypothetical protein GQ53DRAFT_837447 [Thozetella sp. PMI_491]|nr:hypothetical protein GQ53DRAFT_837447 [Thozetella sp. PMI_491]
MQTFHHFPNLPPEIRHAIFLLATPPRIVHVQEFLESYDDFVERFQNGPIYENNIHPDIADFLRRQLPFVDLINFRQLVYRTNFRRLRQATLHGYGFTSDQAIAAPPWEFEERLPFHWIMEDLDLGLQIFRKGALRSTAPIPSLLHTCVESRAVLIESGYQLAFATRTNDPQTWFHFGRDVLLVESEYGNWADHRLEQQHRLEHGLEHRRRGHWRKYETHEMFDFLLSGDNWHVGQFRPKDLEKVRRLALTKSTNTEASSHILAHLPEVEELFLVNWDPSDCKNALRRTAMTPRAHPQELELPSHLGGNKEGWCFVPVEEADSLWTTQDVAIFGRNDDDDNATIDGHAYWLREHKIRHGASSVFLEWVETNSGFWDARDRALSADPSLAPWNIPRIRYVHLCTPFVAKLIAANRRALLEEVGNMKERELRGKPSPPVFMTQWRQEDSSHYLWNHSKMVDSWIRHISLHPRYPGLLYIDL